jgi:hypothetical protein
LTANACGLPTPLRMRQVPDDPDDPVFSFFLSHTHAAVHADDEPALATQMSFTTGAMLEAQP